MQTWLITESTIYRAFSKHTYPFPTLELMFQNFWGVRPMCVCNQWIMCRQYWETTGIMLSAKWLLLPAKTCMASFSGHGEVTLPWDTILNSLSVYVLLANWCCRDSKDSRLSKTAWGGNHTSQFVDIVLQMVQDLSQGDFSFQSELIQDFCLTHCLIL